MRAVDPIAHLVANGFDYLKFSNHHFRIEHRVDFWPSTGKWRFANGEDGRGVITLIARLRRIPELAPLYDEAPARNADPTQKAKR